jgi:hypothetical protein
MVYETSIRMRRVPLLLFPLVLILLSGCHHRVVERKPEIDSVLNDLKRLEEEQGKWLIAVNESRARIERILSEKRKAAEVTAQNSGEPILVEMEVLALAADPQAPFRYRGRVRLKQPPAYRDREVDALLLSHQRNLIGLTGQSVEVETHTKILDQQLEPLGPFSIEGHSTFAADDHNGRFRQFDETRFSQPVSLSGWIVDFDADPERRNGYFMFDILFAGDIATVVIESPEFYRGAELRILVEHEEDAANAPWKQVGAAVTFSTSEATVLWEPWGFTRAADLKDVTFLPARK